MRRVFGVNAGRQSRLLRLHKERTKAMRLFSGVVPAPQKIPSRPMSFEEWQVRVRPIRIGCHTSSH